MRSKIKIITLLLVIFILSLPFIMMVNNDYVSNLWDAVRYLVNVFKIGKPLPIIKIFVSNIIVYIIKAVISFVIVYLTLIVSFFIARSFLLYISRGEYDYNETYEFFQSIKEKHFNDIFSMMALMIVILFPIVYTVISIIKSFIR